MTSPPGPMGDWNPAFAPDGRTLVLSRHQQIFTGALFRLPLSDDLTPAGEPQRFTFENAFTGTPACTPEGREIVFSMGAYSSPSLYRMRASPSAKPRRLTSVGEDGLFPAISGPARRLAYSRARFNADIWRIDIGGPDGEAGAPERVIHSSRWDSSARYSPDGRRIVFRSDLSGSAEVWVANSDGSNAVQLTRGVIAGGPNWSPDSKWITFVGRPEGQPDIYVVSSEGGTPRRVTTDPADDSHPSWSHDGKWIYFSSTRTGNYQVWKIPPSGGEPILVT
ncbi:MAG: hypothetical protein GY953_00060, partial [bacterium]|nr:hypothetical protein [bacterium]